MKRQAKKRPVKKPRVTLLRRFNEAEELNHAYFDGQSQKLQSLEARLETFVKVIADNDLKQSTRIGAVERGKQAIFERLDKLEAWRTSEARYRVEQASTKSDAHSYMECLKSIAAVIEGEVSGVSARIQIAELLTRVGIQVQRTRW